MNSKYANIIQESIAPKHAHRLRPGPGSASLSSARSGTAIPCRPRPSMWSISWSSKPPSRRGTASRWRWGPSCCCAARSTRSIAAAASPRRPTDAEVVEVMRGLTRIRGAAVRRVEALREYHIEDMLGCLRRAPDRPAGRGAAGAGLRGRAAALGDLRPAGAGLRAGAGRQSHDPHHPSVQDRSARIGPAHRHSRGQAHPAHHAAATLAAGFGHHRRLCVPVDEPLRAGSRAGRCTIRTSPRLIKAYAARIGLQPQNFSGHSLRAGFVTSAAAHHARLDKIMEVTRHRNPATVLQYIRDANVFADHAGEKFL